MFLFALSIVFFSCSEKKEITTGTVYDFQSFFESEIKRLAQIKPFILNKNVTLDKVTEQKQFSNPDISEELALFRKISIKPVNWRNLYHLDSARQLENSLSALYFSTSDPKLEIRQVIITDTMEWKNNNAFYPVINTPFQLLFVLNKSNALTQSTKKLVYQPLNGYLIKGSQKTIYLKDREYSVRAWWTNN